MISEKVEKTKEELLKEAKEKTKALNSVFEDVEEKYGSGVVFDTKKRIEVIPTGSIGLDIAIGRGGWPRGRIVDLYGRESSGKSLISALTMAEVQKLGGVAVLIDAEHAFDPDWAKKHKVNPDDLKVFQPDNGEQVFNIAEQVIRSSAVDLVVIDSTAAIVPISIVESAMEDKKIADQARLISVGLQKLTPLVSKTKTVLMFIDQVRAPIGVRTFPGMQVEERPTGGAALNFYSSVRFRVKRKETIKDGSDVIGYRLNLKNKKNKVSKPFKEAEFDLYYDTGIDQISEIFDNTLKCNIITLEGKTYTYKTQKWIGQEKMREAIKGDIKIQKELLMDLDKYKRSLQ